jgi:NhaA family Na+:H+ antiporter
MDLKYRNKNFIWIFGAIDKFKQIINPGILMLLVAMITMYIANSPLRSWYESLWTLEFFIGFGEFNLLSHHGVSLTALELINDGLMTVFFFAVGLEIKREILVGELSSFRQAILPIIAALGGMIMPILIFFVVGNAQELSPTEMRGVAIPMATDIAFSIGILTLLGKRVPLSLKIFLLALAIVDDIGGILVIAVFYSDFSTASFVYLAISLIFLGLLFAGNQLRVNNKLFYLLNGIAIWYLFLQAGIHPTIAGVITAFMVPGRPYLDIKKYTEELHRDLDVLDSTIPRGGFGSIVLTNTQIKYLARVEAASDHVISPLQHFEDDLHDLVNYIIMPLFAFANAGVVFSLSHFPLFSGISLNILCGLFLGKMSGIFLFTWLTIKLRISRMPHRMSLKSLYAVSILGGVGFTVSLFLAGLSYPVGSELLNDAKLGVISGSVVSGALGYLLLRLTLPKVKGNSPEDDELALHKNKNH